MDIIVSNMLRVVNPSLDMMYWIKRFLQFPNPDYAKKQRMGLYTGNTPKNIVLYERDGLDLLMPFGVLKRIPQEYIKFTHFSTDLPTPVKIDYNASIPLRDYQQIAVDELIKQKYGILQAPAGSGKTQIGLGVAFTLGRRTLWLAHTKDLINQSKTRAEQYIDKSLIGTITEGKVDIGEGITFATIQTMSKLDLSKYRDYWDCIIVDEVHRVSGTPSCVTQYSKVLNALRVRHRYGLSATIHRSDNMIKATIALMGEVAYTVPSRAVGGCIMQVGIKPVNTGIRLTTQALDTDGTLNYSNFISYLVNNTDRNKLIVSYIEKKPSIILSERVSHLETLMSLLPTNMRKDAVLITGTTKKELREQALDDMRTGKKKYLFATYQLAKEGLDIPRLERLYMVTPQKDYSTITQSLGRIARTKEGKDKPIAYDFVDDIKYTIRMYKVRCTTYRKQGCYFID